MTEQSRRDNATPHLADVYDGQILRTMPNYQFFHEETVRLIKNYKPSPKTWLDTGCGTGTLVRECLQLFPETRFFLADPAEPMLAIAREKLAGQDRVTFLPPASTQALAEEKALQPEVITAIQCHHYLSRQERQRAAQACYDLLAPGGVFVTFENSRPFTDTGIALGEKYWGDFQRANGKAEEEVRQHLDRFDKEYFPITVEEHLQLYRAAGFSVVELLWYSCMQAGFYCIK